MKKSISMLLAAMMLTGALTGTAIALDGIAVVVNPANTIDDLSMDQIKGIYVGDITDWGDLA